jgi:hypothetical protein
VINNEEPLSTETTAAIQCLNELVPLVNDDTLTQAEACLSSTAAGTGAQFNACVGAAALCGAQLSATVSGTVTVPSLLTTTSLLSLITTTSTLPISLEPPS